MITLMELNALNCDEKPALLPINSTQSVLNARFGKGIIKFNELTGNILIICVLFHISEEKYRIMKRPSDEGLEYQKGSTGAGRLLTFDSYSLIILCVKGANPFDAILRM